MWLGYMQCRSFCALIAQRLNTAPSGWGALILQI